MEEIWIRAHSGLRWVVILLLLITLIRSFSGWKGKKAFKKADDKLVLYTMIGVHIQMLIGIILIFVGSKVSWAYDQEQVMAMPARFWAVEHISGMVIGTFLITMGRKRMKKIVDGVRKHKLIFVYYLIGTLIILLSIPWPFRGLGTGWF